MCVRMTNCLFACLPHSKVNVVRKNTLVRHSQLHRKIYIAVGNVKSEWKGRQGKVKEGESRKGMQEQWQATAFGFFS